MNKKLLLIASILVSNHSFGMESKVRKTVQLDPGFVAKTGLPAHLTLLEKDEEITDELLMELNPQYAALQSSLSSEQKTELIQEIFSYPGGDSGWHITRCLYALLIRIGAAPNAPKYHRPLEKSALHQDFELTKYLLAKKADPNIKDIYGHTPIIDARNVRLAELLLEAGSIIPQSILYNCNWCHYPWEMMYFYLNKGIKPIANKDQWTPLHGLVEQLIENTNQLKKTQLLLDGGCDQTIKDNWGNLALHIAASNNRNNYICILLDHFIAQHKTRFNQLLLCLNRNRAALSIPPKDIRIMLFDCVVQRPVRQLLSTKNNDGKTPHDLRPAECLNPNGWTVQKYLAWKNEPEKKNPHE